MRKLLVLICLLFVVAGCTSKPKYDDFNVDTEKMTVPENLEEDYFYVIDDGDADAFINNVGYLSARELWPVGFEIPSIKVETYDGKTLDLSSLKGKPYILEFMASWCSHCQDAATSTVPDLVANSKKYKYVQVFIDADTTEIIDAFYQGLGMDVPKDETLCLGNEDVMNFMRRIGLTSIPTFIFVNAEGRIGFVSVGTKDAAVMASMIELLEDKPAYLFKTSSGSNLFEYIHK